MNVCAYLDVYGRLRICCQATGVAMATILRVTRWGVVLILALEYEVDVTTRNEVMASFTCIHYVRMTQIFDPFKPKLGHMTRNPCCIYVPILKFIGLCAFDIFDYNLQNLWPRCQATVVAMAAILSPTRCGVVLMSAPEYEVDRTTEY